MKKINLHFDVDHIIKIPFNANDKKLRLNEAVVYTINEFLKNRPSVGSTFGDKFDQKNNIDRMFMFIDNESNYDIVMSLNDKEMERSRIVEKVYNADEQKSTKKGLIVDKEDDSSFTAFDKTTKDKTMSEKSGVIKDSYIIKLSNYE
jgi:hypothetical protein